jgi:hypothetical protein
MLDNKINNTHLSPSITASNSPLSYDDIKLASDSISNDFTIPNAQFIIKGDVNVKIGDFEIKGDDLGRLLEKFAKEFMPQILV